MPKASENQEWFAVLDAAELPEGAVKLARAGELGLLLIKREGGLFALENRCPHMDCPLLRGKLEGYTLQCPCHDWKFDIRSGQMLEAKELKVGVYPVKSEAGKIFVNLKGQP